MVLVYIFYRKISSMRGNERSAPKARYGLLCCVYHRYGGESPWSAGISLFLSFSRFTTSETASHLATLHLPLFPPGWLRRKKHQSEIEKQIEELKYDNVSMRINPRDLCRHLLSICAMIVAGAYSRNHEQYMPDDASRRASGFPSPYCVSDQESFRSLSHDLMTVASHKNLSKRSAAVLMSKDELVRVGRDDALCHGFALVDPFPSHDLCWTSMVNSPTLFLPMSSQQY